MKSLRRKVAISALAALLAPNLDNDAQAQLAPGQAQTILSLPEDDWPEGIAMDAEDGAVYVGNRSPFGGSHRTSDIVKIHEDGVVDLHFASLPMTPESESANGLLGLATYQGDLFAALDSDVLGPNGTHGVYKISRNGQRVDRLAGSDNILTPNALTFDDQGNLYVTDSKDGAVWRFDPDNINEPGQLWVQHELLSPNPDDPFGTTNVGANGIAFSNGALFIANTGRYLLARAEIDADGGPGTVDLVAGGDFLGPLSYIDGIAATPDGSILAAMPAFEVLSFLTGLPAAPVVRIDPATGEVTPEVLQDLDNDVFDLPLSLALAVDGSSVFVANGGSFVPAARIPPHPGPGVVQLGIEASPVGAAAVPEPATVLLLFVATAALAGRRATRGPHSTQHHSH